MKKKKKWKSQSRVMKGFEKFVTYGFKGRKITVPIETKK